MPFVDDGSQVFVSGLEKFVEPMPQALHELVVDGGMGEDVIGVQADLSTICQFRVGDSLRGDVDVRRLGDDDRRLSTEFEHNRSQMFGRGFGDDTSDFAASSVEYVVEFMGEYMAGLAWSAGNHTNGAWIQILGYQINKQCLCDWSQLGWFE